MNNRDALLNPSGSSGDREPRFDSSTDLEDGGNEQSTVELNFLDPATDSTLLGRIAQYQVQGVIGQGSMGMVLKAFDEELHRIVAIKILSPHLASSRTFCERFAREARSVAAISHPHVVVMHAVGEHAGLPYLVMEYIDGHTLRHRINHGPPLDVSDIIHIGCQIADGLEAAHEKGIIHRDIKPPNIMLEDGLQRVRITDFGLARAVMNRSELTSLGKVIGTPAYMSPEQVTGGEVDPRSDLFSLGCVLYAAVTGHSPFQGSDTIDIVRKVCDHQPPRLHEISALVPTEFSDVVAKLLEKNPANRFQTAFEVRAALAKINPYAPEALPETRAFRPRSLQTDEDSGDSRRPTGRSGWWAAAVMGVIATAVFVSSPLWLTQQTELNANGSSAAEGLSGTDSNAKQPVPPGPRDEARVLTVARDGEADYRSIDEALRHCSQGEVIRILDDGVYHASLKLDGRARWHGLTLEAPRGAVLASADETAPVLTLEDARDITFRGFRLDAPLENRAIFIKGSCNGITIADIRCRQPAEADTVPVVQINAGRGAEADRPIRIVDSSIACEGEGQCIWIYGDTAPNVTAYLRGNRFSGEGSHVVLWGSCREMEIAENVFVGGENGINLNLKTPPALETIRIVNNTFAGTTYWLGFVKSDVRRFNAVVANNLIIGGKRVQGSSDQLEEAAQQWDFRANWWERGARVVPGAGLHGRIAEMHDRIELLSRDPGHEDFLRPPAGSPLGDSGCGGDYPRHIGAFPPARTGKNRL